MTADKKYIYGLEHLLNEEIDANNFYTTSIWADFANFNKNIWPAIKYGRWIERWAVLLLFMIFVKAAPMDSSILLKGVFGLWMTYISFLAIILGSSIAFFLSRLIFIRKYKPLGVKNGNLRQSQLILRISNNVKV